MTFKFQSSTFSNQLNETRHFSRVNFIYCIVCNKLFIAHYLLHSLQGKIYWTLDLLYSFTVHTSGLNTLKCWLFLHLEFIWFTRVHSIEMLQLNSRCIKTMHQYIDALYMKRLAYFSSKSNFVHTEWIKFVNSRHYDL